MSDQAEPRPRTDGRRPIRSWLQERASERSFPLTRLARAKEALGPYETRYEVRSGYPERDRFGGD